MVRTEIVEQRLGFDRSFGIVEPAVCGAVVEFQGVVRDTEEGEEIQALEYECHVAMAEAQLSSIAQDIATGHRLADLTVFHRIGKIPVGDTSLYVRAVAGHRQEAFAAVMELIDRLKRDVPIWKHPVRKHGR